MKTNITLLISHSAIALVSGGAGFIGSQVAPDYSWIITLGAGLTAAAISALLVSGKVNQGLSQIAKMLTDFQNQSSVDCGISEIDQLGTTLQHSAERYEKIEIDSRRNERELKSMVARLAEREDIHDVDLGQFKNALGGVGQSLHQLISQLESGVVEVSRSQAGSLQGQQAEMAMRSNSLLQNLSAGMEKVAERCLQLRQQIGSAEQTVERAIEKTNSLSEAVQRIRACSESSKKKLRSLGDPTRQISNIVSNIADIAARTEMLALNASIESIRAGEHGRGFAVVADEVRKLAEQTAHSAGEISVLAESLEMQTSDSLNVISREQREVDSEIAVVESIRETLNELSQVTNSGMFVVSDLSQQGEQQKGLIQGLAGGLESINAAGQADRKRSDSAAWAIQTLAKTAIDLDVNIHRLRGCTNPNLERYPAQRNQLVDLVRAPAATSEPNAAHDPNALPREGV
ncbi:Methyl-accepting chemotaxis protein McpB [Stieleria bergensis]|uniref:Methyl-accepting chemotaxis protein McpB n=1 Tax=Stieleria bergensis TaxID=2528025 RepID=A0A517SPC3_9BACT|nr:MAG: hypothetical protein CBB71_05405 [Rhodopirellula sp. TMED11]QDT57966.1 Methyl-accepting chemotaxis protein McpB [Planctomycetes bacterium SV_7m_r]